MRITPFLATRGAISYIVEQYAEQHANVTLVDPSLEECERILVYLKQHDLALNTIIETHTHADYFSSVGILREIYPSVLTKRGNFDDIAIKGVKAIKTPGHTQNSYTFHITEAGQDHLFTGDTLLIGGTGRTDFQGGSSIDLYYSLQHIIEYPLDTIIHPGHNYQGITSSTLEEELKNNQRLRLVKNGHFDEFVNLMDNHTPPIPDLFKESLAFNGTLYTTD